MTVKAFTPRNNAQLMADVHALGYLDGAVLDATYGAGRFWKKVRPQLFITNDINPATDADYHDDFRSLRWADRAFEVVVLDPPYKLNGTPSKGGPANSDEGYGVGGQAVRWQERHAIIRDGIIECARVCARTLLIKCQDQVCSGAVRWQTIEFTRTAEGAGFRLVDMLHVPGHRKQPEGRRQVHAARNYSTLLVLERGQA